MRSSGLPFLVLAAIAVATACSEDPPPPPEAAPVGQDGGPDADLSIPEEKDSGGDAPARPSKVNVTNETIDVEGTDREYVLAVPKTFDAARAYPLVLVFHGDGGDGPGMRAYHTLDDASGDEALVAYPTGIDRTWDLDSSNADNRDIKFVEALVATLSETYSVDAARIFGTGYSSGGFLVNKIACRKSDLFRGIVSYAGGAPYEGGEDGPKWPSGHPKCEGQQEGGVAAMIVHGTDDGAVTPDSGDYDAAYWASLNGCGDTQSDASPSPCKAYDGCPAGKPVLWCLIPGLGHAVWDRGTTEGWAFMNSL